MRLHHTHMHDRRYLSSSRVFGLWIGFQLDTSQSAAANARRPHQVSGIAYLPNILHKCDRFDLSPRTNGKSKCSETRPMGAGRRQIESVALCVWQCHLRNVSTLSNRTPIFSCLTQELFSRSRLRRTQRRDRLDLSSTRAFELRIGFQMANQ